MSSTDPGRRPETPPAFILGSGITALGVFRILGRKGIPVLSLQARPGFEKRSKWFERARETGLSGTSESVAECLRETHHEGGVLIPCSDEFALETASLDDDLSQRFRSCVPPLETLELLIDKGKFHERLVSKGIPHPTTHVVDDPSDFASLFDTKRPRYFIKPRLSHRFRQEVGLK
ncbi:unnamed protein product, partial [marine sediment metagenome]